MLVPTELRRVVRLALAATMMIALIGPVFDTGAATDLYPGAPAIAAGQSAPYASVRTAPDPAAVELVQIDDGIAAEIVAGPMAGADGLVWYQVNVAGLSGYITGDDLAWGVNESPDPDPVDEPVALAVTGNGVVISPDGTDIRCRIEPRDDADVLFAYPSGSGVDLAGPPADDWQPVICAAQLGYLPAPLVFDPANLPQPEPAETADSAETATGTVTEETTPADIPEVTETVVIVDEPPAPAAVETATVETATIETEISESDETIVELTETPEITETVSEAPLPAETATPTGDGASAPASDENTETATPPAEPTEILEVIAPAEPVGQTIAGDDAPVFAAALASAAAVYNTGGAGLRCRVGPSLDAQVLLVLPLGAPVTLTGRSVDGWQPVICNGNNGFVAVRFLQPTDGGTIDQGQTTPVVSPPGSALVVQNTGGAGLRCRSAGSLTASIITVLPEGTTLATRGSASGSWQPVTCAGAAGWVYTDFVGDAPASGSGGSNNGGSATGPAMVANTGGDGVRFRAGASFDAAVIAVLMDGASLTLRSGSTGGWTAVTYDGRNGFIYSDYVATARNPSNPGSGSGVGSTSLSPGSNARVTDTLNFRSAASYSAGVVGIAPIGTVVQVTGASTGGFYPVKWGGTAGFMHGDYLVYTTEALSPSGPNGGVGGTTGGGPGAGNGPGSTRGQAMVDYAMRYLGYPYVWATHGPNSFDCSGFTYWVVLNIAGRDIGAGTWTQWETGSPVQYGSLQPGDLVFFQNTYTVGLSHVGMYIGNDQFIHAENENTGVRISSLTSTYYATRYLGARRIA